MIQNILLLLFGLLGLVKSMVIPTETYPRNATLQTDGYLLYWKHSDGIITFEIHAKTFGWVGLGVSSNGDMVGGDIFVGWITENGVAKITDRHGAATNGFPPLDTEQNIEILEGKECDGWTILKFRRQLARCETDHDRRITTSTERVIWAYGATDPESSDLVAGDQHSTMNRGVMSLYLLEPTDSPTSLPVGPTYLTFDLLMSEFNVPAVDTYYNCKLFRFPFVPQKHHIVKYEPIITSGNEKNVHHMLLYQCADRLQNPLELGMDGQCYTNVMAHFRTCSTVIIGWAIGGETHIFNDEAGNSFGESGDPIYVLLEIHYDNPEKVSTITDSSGLRLTYTSTLRDNDLGILEVGNFVNGAYHFIPPGATSFVTRGICGNACLTSAMAAAGVTNITVAAVMLHSHLAGREMKLRHIRNGVEQRYLGFDETYDFNFQTLRYLSPVVAIILGDDLMLECTYNTEGKEEMTEAGLETDDEMCLAYLLYYPRIDLAKCESNVQNSISYEHVGIYGFTQRNPGAGLAGTVVTDPPLLAGETVKDVMDNINWEEDTIRQFEKSLLSPNTTHFQICRLQSSNTFLPLNQPSVTSVYTPTFNACVTPDAAMSQSRQAGTCSGSQGTIAPYTNFTALLFVLIIGKIMSNGC